MSSTQIVLLVLGVAVASILVTLFVVSLCSAAAASSPHREEQHERAGPETLHAGEMIRAMAPLEVRDGLAFEVQPTDIWAARLGNFVIWSGVFDVKRPWIGTAAELRDALIGEGSRLTWKSKREIPNAEALDRRLQAMLNGQGRMIVKREGFSPAGQVWSLAPAAAIPEKSSPPC